MHVLVAGSTGVLGRRIVRLLVGQGHQVTALTRRSDRADLLRSAGADPVVTDAFDPVSLAAAVKRAAPEVIMNQLTDLTSGNSTANAAMRAGPATSWTPPTPPVSAGLSLRASRGPMRPTPAQPTKGHRWTSAGGIRSVVCASVWPDDPSATAGRLHSLADGGAAMPVDSSSESWGRVSGSATPAPGGRLLRRRRQRARKAAHARD